LTVEIHVADRAFDEPRRQAIAQPLECRAVHRLAIELAGRVGRFRMEWVFGATLSLKWDQSSSVIFHNLNELY
jgi:hypothetical protein